jgi:hypothetical protein
MSPRLSAKGELHRVDKLDVETFHYLQIDRTERSKKPSSFRAVSAAFS